MAYGTVKADSITFTNNSADVTTTVSGIYASTTNNLTLTGTAQALTVSATTGSFTSLTGTTTTGTTANFVSGVFTTQLSGVTITGTTVSATTGNFTSLTGTTTTGTTANFVSGVFSTQLSGVTITGTTVSATTGTFQVLNTPIVNVGGNLTVASGLTVTGIAQFSAGTAAAPSISFAADTNTGAFNPAADALAISTNGVERARIDSSGRLLVGTSTVGAGLGFSTRFTLDAGGAVDAAVIKNSAGDQATCLYLWNATTTSNNAFMSFATETAVAYRGSINYNRAGGLVAYNTTSDYRAKDISGPVQKPGATIDALKVYEGKMKGATQSRPMLIAHEVQEHAPYAVIGKKNALRKDGTPEFQQMDVSTLVPLLLAEIQSLRQRVATLETA